MINKCTKFRRDFFVSNVKVRRYRVRGKQT